MKNSILYIFKKALLLLITLLALVILAVGCSSQNDNAEKVDIKPEDVVSAVVESILYIKESDYATDALTMNAEAIRKEFFISASAIYQNQRGFTQQQADAMTEKLFYAIDNSIKYRLSEAVYSSGRNKTSPMTATIIIYITSIDQAAFEQFSNNSYAAYSSEDISNMTEAEQKQLACDIFFLSCENTTLQENEKRIPVKLKEKVNGDWQIEGADSLLIDLFAAYTGTS